MRCLPEPDGGGPKPDYVHVWHGEKTGANGKHGRIDARHLMGVDVDVQVDEDGTGVLDVWMRMICGARRMTRDPMISLLIPLPVFLSAAVSFSVLVLVNSFCRLVPGHEFTLSLVCFFSMSITVRTTAVQDSRRIHPPDTAWAKEDNTGDDGWADEGEDGGGRR